MLIQIRLHGVKLIRSKHDSERGYLLIKFNAASLGILHRGYDEDEI